MGIFKKPYIYFNKSNYKNNMRKKKKDIFLKINVFLILSKNKINCYRKIKLFLFNEHLLFITSLITLLKKVKYKY